MRDLVRHGRPADEFGREDQPPAVADRAVRRRSSPSARPDRRSPTRDAMTPALAQTRGSRGRSRSSACALSQRSRRRSSPSGGPPASSRPSPRSIRRGRGRIPVEPVRHAFERHDARRARTASASGMSASAALDPGALPRRPGQRAPLARPAAARSASPPRVRGSTRSRIRRARGVHPDRHRRPADRRAFRGGGRRDDVRDRPLHLPKPSSRAPTCRPRAPSRGRR